MSSNIAHPELLAEIKAACARHNIAPSTFGLRAVNDSHLISDLETGAELRRGRRTKVRALLDQLAEETPSPAAAETAR